MKNIVSILSFILFLSGNVQAQKKLDSVQLQRKARKFVREGNKLYNQQKFTDASVAYKKSLSQNAAYEKATYNLGNALYQNKNFQEAAPQFGLAAKNAKDKPSKAEAYHNLGNAMMELKKYPEAVEAYKNALRNNPNDDETRYNLAVAKSKVEDQKQNQKNEKENKEQDKKDKQDKDDNKNDKNKNDGKDKDKDKKDPKKNEGDDDNKENKNKDPKKDDNKDKKKPKPKSNLSPQQLKQLLESLNNEEKKTQKKMNAKKSKGPKIKQEKDW